MELWRAWKRHPVWSRWAAAAVFAVYLAAAVLTLVRPEYGISVGPMALFLLAFSGSVTFFVVGSHIPEPNSRRPWQLAGTGLGVVTVGLLTIAVIEMVSPGTVPAFSPFDLFFLVGYALSIAGIASLPQVATDWSQRARTIIDGIIGAVSFSIVAWVLVLHDVFDRVGQLTDWERYIGFAYPTLDVLALIVVMTVVARRSAYRFDIRLTLIGVGFVVQAAADMAFLLRGLGSSLSEAQPVWAINMTALAAFFVAALMLRVQPKRIEFAERKSRIASVIAPYASAVFMTGFMLWDAANREQGPEFWTLLGGSVAVAVLVVARQGLAIRENRITLERQRSSLVSSISHELRTPLTAMVGFLDLIVDDALEDDEKEEFIRIVHQQGRYLVRIVSDLVMLARGNLEEIELQEATVPVRSIVVEAQRAVEMRRHNLRVEASGELAVRADVDRLQQILVNLIGNAVRYGTKEVLVRARQDGHAVVIEVHDDGPGVPKRYELAVWERFERGAHRLDATKPGSGIGLAVVKAIVTAHRGEVEYRTSEILGGACFVVRLPGRARRLPAKEVVG